MINVTNLTFEVPELYQEIHVSEVINQICDKLNYWVLVFVMIALTYFILRDFYFPFLKDITKSLNQDSLTKIIHRIEDICEDVAFMGLCFIVGLFYYQGQLKGFFLLWGISLSIITIIGMFRSWRKRKNVR